MNNKMQVFISYAKEDHKIAIQLWNDLKKPSITPWMDTEDIIAGQDTNKEIRKAIKESSFFLILLSSKSVSKRDPVQRQLKIAKEVFEEFPESEIFIIPVRIDDWKSPDEMLQKLQCADISHSYEKGLKQILRALCPDKRTETELAHDTPAIRIQSLRTVLAHPDHQFPAKLIFISVLCICLFLTLLYHHKIWPFQNPILEHHLASGNSFLNTGKFAQAKQEYTQAHELDPDNIKINSGLSKVRIYEQLYEMHYETSAIEQNITHILDKNPDDPHAYVLLGHLHSSADPDIAARNYKKAILLDSSVATAYFGLGVLRHKQENLEKALELFKNAVSLSKSNVKYLNNLAYLYYKTEQYQEAIKTYKRILDSDYEYLISYYEIAIVLQIRGELDKALWYQQKLVKLLDDEKITSLQKNKDSWYFETSDKPVFFYELPKKKCYAYCSLSVTLYLMGQETEAAAYMIKANGLKINDNDKLSVIELVLTDLMRLQNKNLKNRAEKFRVKFFQ